MSSIVTAFFDEKMLENEMVTFSKKSDSKSDFWLKRSNNVVALCYNRGVNIKNQKIRIGVLICRPIGKWLSHL